ncbi:MAG: sulfatase-like hydrolase/transferase [Deltaproteobacteria bacterium]|nr:sulfatase-like hydrolase/transferase [Deltaproteobacteria bacterium]
MFKNLIVKGVFRGISAGLLITLFDGLFMLIPDTQVPYSYPLLLITFNTFAWMTLGGLSGVSLWIFVRKREGIHEKEDFYWLIFFLVPFAIIYGVLGRLFFPLQFWEGIAGPSVFDHHLSFVWVLLILIFLAFSLKKTRTQRNTFISPSFTLEITAFILLFQFCSNFLYIKTIFDFLNNLELFPNIELTHNQLYILGVLLIMGFYFITCLTIRPLLNRRLVGNNYYKIVVLLFIVSGCLTSFYAWSHKRQIKGELFSTTSTQNQRTGKDSNVILIVLDTVRSDRLSMYGHPGVTKNLQEFSKDTLIFENCVATSSWTIPSHASLFTGFYPTEHGSHGILDPKKSNIFGRPITAPLSEEFVTLAEVFKNSGYKTCAVASNRIVLSPEIKLGQGFQITDNSWNIGHIYQIYPFRPIIHLFCYLTNIYPKYTLYYRTADEITKESIYLLEKLSPPAFLFVNYLDAHGPYSPPRPFSGYFLDTPFPQLYRLKQYFRRYIKKRWNKQHWDSYQLSQYDGEIAYLDDELGKLFSRLKQMGMYDSSLIIVTSEHGELFGEQGFYWHVGPIYEEIAKIPLMIKFPYSKRVGREKRMITLADLYPTILSICDLPIPEGISGKSFGNNASPVVSELYEFKTGEHRVLYDMKYKYMEYGHTKGSELYDLDNDPKEKENLAERLPSVVAIMEQKLREWKNTHTPQYTSSVDEEVTMTQSMREQLKALGYIQ